MSNFTRITPVLIVALCLAFCAGKPKQPKTVDANIALSVQKDVLQQAINRRLCALEAITAQPSKTTMKPSPVAISASEAIHANRVPQ